MAPPPWRPEVEYHVTEVAEDEAPSAPSRAPASSPDVMADVPLSTAAFVTGPEPAMAGIAPPAGIGGIAPPAGVTNDEETMTAEQS